MLGIIGKKVGMTRVEVDAELTPCTIIESKGCVVTQIKEASKDGYDAIQLGYDEKKTKNTKQPLLKHFEKAKTTPKKKLVEFRDFASDFGDKKVDMGHTIQAQDIFEEGEFIDVTAFSKGKGFQGVVKRHGFSGVGDRTHGQHNRERAPGSIGGASYPSRVFPNMRMAGQMGHDRVTVKNLKIIKILPQEGIILVKGAVPGPKKAYITLQK